MFRLVMYETAADLGQVLTAIAAVQDDSVTLAASAAGIVVPDDTSKLAGVFGVMEPLTTTQIQIQSPSLRKTTNPTIEPFTLDASVPASPIPMWFAGANPIDLDPLETLQAFVNSDELVVQYVGVLLADGPMTPVQGKGQNVAISATIQAAVATWASGQITFSQQLPAGTYRVTGLRMRGTGLVAARLIFDDRVARPGVPAALGLGGLDAVYARGGAVGDWGEFKNTNPPRLEVIGGTAAVQTGVLDLIKV